MENITDRFVQEIWSLGNSQLPQSASWHAQRCLLDYLGATLAGSRAVEDQLLRMIDDLGGTEPVAPLIGLKQKASVMTAALVNGIASHAVELDDGVISGIVHPGAPVFSALLPFAAKHEISGNRLIRGIVAGYESTVRIANSIQPAHKISGYHATATCGAIGGAIGIMTMTGATPELMKHALSAAAVAAGGSLKVLEDDSQLKPFNPGHAALSAIVAASIANSGFRGPNDVLSGKAGFLEMMAGQYNPAALFPGDGADLSLERVYFKPYAACRYTHPAIEAALKVRSALDVDLDAIESIQVYTYELAVKHHDHTKISGVSSAKMSIPFSVAVALANGKAGIDEYTETQIADPRIKGLTAKVSVFPDNGFTALFPAKTGARVEMLLVDGTRQCAEVDMPKGEPDNPLTDEEVNAKFEALARFRGLDSIDIDAMQDAVWHLSDKASQLYKLL